MNVGNVNYMSIDSIVTKYTKVFADELGSIKGVKAELHIQEETTVFKARSLLICFETQGRGRFATSVGCWGH